MAVATMPNTPMITAWSHWFRGTRTLCPWSLAMARVTREIMRLVKNMRLKMGRPSIISCFCMEGMMPMMVAEKTTARIPVPMAASLSFWSERRRR